MRNGLRGVIIAAGAAAVTAFLWLAAIPTAGQQATPAGQFSSYRAPRLADGHPDLNGIWQAFGSANWDLQDHAAQPGPHPEIMGAYGGGPAGQAGAVRHGIARALIVADATLRPTLKADGLLTRDPRMRERKKYGQPGARKRFQYSKR